ncbi:MAG: histidine phosphatase family protein [Rhodothermales bacterium]
MPPTTLYFVRHGETDYNRLRIMQGRRVDSSLNDIGRLQAAALGSRLEDIPIDVIYTSALRRTTETADHVARNHSSAERKRTSDLDEMCWGIYEGEAWSDSLEAMLDEMYSRWERGEFDYRVPEGESILDVQERGLRAVERILDEHRGQTVLVVTHGRLLRVLLATLLDFGLERMNEINHANTGVNILTHIDGRFECTLLNCTSHLENVCPVLVE